MRFSILSLLGLVAIAAFGCMAVMHSSQGWWQATSLVVLLVLGGAFLATFYYRGHARAFCLGFAIIGYSYFISHVGWTALIDPNIAISRLYEEMNEQLPPDPRNSESIFNEGSFDTRTYFHWTCNALLSLILACIGGAFACFLYSRKAAADHLQSHSVAPEHPGANR